MACRHAGPWSRKISATSRTGRDTSAAQDPALRLLADSFAPVTTLVGKTWRLHLDKVTRVDPEENLAMIADSVAFLRDQGKRCQMAEIGSQLPGEKDPAHGRNPTCLEAALQARLRAVGAPS